MIGGAPVRRLRFYPGSCPSRTAAKAAQDEWERLPPSRRGETIVVDGGRRLKVRLIEME